MANERCGRSGTYLDETLGDRHRAIAYFVTSTVSESTCGACGAVLANETADNTAVRVPEHEQGQRDTPWPWNEPLARAPLGGPPWR